MIDKDFQKPNEVNISKTLSTAWKEIKAGFFARREYFTSITLVLAMTGLFLNINTQDASLKRVQALFLLISIVCISWFLLSLFQYSLRGKVSELYYAVMATFMFITLLLIFNLFSYLFTNFQDALSFYLKWLGVPLITLSVNVLSIYTFRLIRKYKSIEEPGRLESFFLIILNLHIVVAYSTNNLEFIPTLSSLLVVSIGSLYVIYLFLIALYDEIFLEERIQRHISNKNQFWVSLFIWAFVSTLPAVIHYIILPWIIELEFGI